MNDKFWRAKQDYIKYYNELPLDEKVILLESEHGKKLDGNIFYLIKYLATSPKYKDYKIYVSAMGRNLRPFRAFLKSHQITRVSLVMLASDEYMRLLASAKYLINDTSFGPYYVKKEGQIYLNTWHGTPLKALGKSDISGYHTMGNIQVNFLKSDYLLYPNEYMRDIMIKDYMLENVSTGKVVLSGYPRNEIFYDTDSRAAIRKQLNIGDKRVYVYMPTYRGSVGKGKTSKSTTYLSFYLYELEKNLGEDEILYVNLHPLAKDGINFSEFKKIKTFPQGYEVYEFLNIADVLITDYSSVFFDFAITGQKIVLFTYDEEEYLATRGMYMNIADLPFPRTYDIQGLLDALRSEKDYDDSEFLNTYCRYERKNASETLCDAVILGTDNDAIIEAMPSNNKENVLIYAGNLAPNGITTSLRSLLNTLDLSKRNYILTFRTENVSKNRQNIKTFPEEISYIPIPSDYNVTVKERIMRKLFKLRKMSAKAFMKRCKDTSALALKQYYGDAKIDHVIQFNGYESEVILLFSAFTVNTTIFVHNNMVAEIKSKHKQRMDVLNYAYNHYDNVALVTEDMIEPTKAIAQNDKRFRIVKNTINYQNVLNKSSEDFTRSSYSKATVSFEVMRNALSSCSKKFINIGRFSPEKGQERLINAFNTYNKENPDSCLFIVGGVANPGMFEKLTAQINALNLSEKVFLVFDMPNPFSLLKECDFFILSSLHEGFGLVLAEADILGKPIVSTDIDGPRLFMKKHGGALVDNSEAGVLEGLKLLGSKKIAPINVDYAKYNDEVVEQFESLF